MCSRLAHEKHARAEAVARLEQLKSRRDALAAIARAALELPGLPAGALLWALLAQGPQQAGGFYIMASTSSTGAMAYPFKNFKEIKQLARVGLHAARPGRTGAQPL